VGSNALLIVQGCSSAFICSPAEDGAATQMNQVEHHLSSRLGKPCRRPYAWRAL